MTVNPRSILATVTVALIVAGIVAVGVLSVQYAGLRSQENARTSALDAAQRYATTMFGYTPENIADHVERSRQILTGVAAGEYDQTLSDSNLIDAVRTQEVVSDAAIQEAGVVTNTRDSATVLLFINLSVTQGTGERALTRLDPSRVTFEMVKQDGTWKITEIEAIEDATLRDMLIEAGEDVAEGSISVEVEGDDAAEPTPVPGG